MALAIFLLSFFVFFICGMPIAFTMLVSAWIYAMFAHVEFSFLSLEMFASINSFVLIALPMFMLTAEIMNVSTIADRIFKFSNSLIGFIPGGLGHVNVFTNVIFAGMSGSAAADASGIGYLSYKAMAEKGFDKPFSAAVTASAACIGPIIPPSIPMVIYAMVANASIGKLFLGGVIPGLLMALAMMVYIYFISKKRGYPLDKREKFAVLLTNFIRSILPLLTPVILLCGITFGIVTVTEAAVVAVIYSCILGGLLYRILGFQNFIGAIKITFMSIGSVVILFPAARLFGFVLTKENISMQIANLFINISDNPIILILMINVLFLILGCFSDPLVNIILFVPVVLPIANAIHMDPIHFGVMIVFNTMIGLITPPVGGMLFITSAITKVSFEKIVKEIWPFIVGLLIVLLIIIFFPQVVTVLPNMFFK